MVVVHAVGASCARMQAQRNAHKECSAILPRPSRTGQKQMGMR